MKHSLSLVGTLAVVCATVLPVASSRLFAESDPSAGRLPIDLARGSLGARLEVRAPKGSESSARVDGTNHSAQALISDDASLSYPLAEGATSMILTLRKADVLSRLNFLDFGANGKLTISASSTKLPFESTDWHPVAKGQSFAGTGTIGCDLGSLEARYLKLDFQTDAPGRISGLGVFGLLTINSLDPHPVSVYDVTANLGVNTASAAQGENVYFDYFNLNTGAKVVGVSGGSSLGSAQAMLDGNVETDFSFSPTDPSPTVVIDLSARRSLNRVSCVYQAPPGRIDFYLVDNPYTSDYQRSASLNYVSSPTTQPADSGTAEYHRTELSKHKAVCSINTNGQSGVTHASASIGGASGRFLVAEFHPIAQGARVDYNHVEKDRDFKDAPDFKDRDFKDFKDKDVAEGQPFRLISLSGFGDYHPGDNISRIPNVPPGTVVPPGGGSANPPTFPGSGGTVIVTPPISD